MFVMEFIVETIANSVMIYIVFVSRIIYICGFAMLT